jgi:GR25 family glycosyltransferase involved in LPS biosynthesis
LFPKLEYLLILEDDILLSNDTLVFFERCKAEMRLHHEISVATTYHLFR